jgi:hypothetical protein
MKKWKPPGLFEELNDKQDEFRLVIMFLRSLIIGELRKESYQVWNNKNQTWTRKHYILSLYQEVDIDRKIGSFHIYNTNEDRMIVVEKKNLKYMFPPVMLHRVVQGLTKATR